MKLLYGLFVMLILLSAPLLAETQSSHITFLGDSLTAGYGVGEEHAYPNVVKQHLSKKGQQVSILNAGVSGDTTAGGLRRVDWVLQKEPDILFLALGANDSLRGLDPAAAKENLREIILATRKRHPNAKIILAGIKSPPSMGEDYCTRFDGIYQELAKEEEVTLVPFLLEGVAGKKNLNLEDLIHPNKDGQEAIAKMILPVIEAELGS